MARAEEDPFTLLDALPPVDGSGVGGGWFGWLGFGLGARLERLAPAPPRQVARAPHGLAFHDHVVRLDANGAWWWEALVTPEREEALAERRRVWEERFDAPAAVRRTAATGPWRALPGPAGHAAAVVAARGRIRAGDLFQANLALRLEAGLEGELLDLWAAAVGSLSPARAAWFRDGDGEVDEDALEAYTGAMGFASPLAGLELNVAIRTFEAADRRIWLQAGGGVVADSDAAAETEEALAKARPLLAAIDAEGLEHRPVGATEDPRAPGALPASGRGPSPGPTPRSGSSRPCASRTGSRSTSPTTSGGWGGRSPSCTGSRSPPPPRHACWWPPGQPPARRACASTPGPYAGASSSMSSRARCPRPSPSACAPSSCPAGSVPTSGATGAGSTLTPHPARCCCSSTSTGSCSRPAAPP